MTERDTCKTCRFYLVADPPRIEAGNGGWCRRRAPAPRFPLIVFPDKSWCGEHERELGGIMLGEVVCNEHEPAKPAGGLKSILGKWPGDETDEEVALAMSGSCKHRFAVADEGDSPYRVERCLDCREVRHSIRTSSNTGSGEGPR